MSYIVIKNALVATMPRLSETSTGQKVLTFRIAEYIELDLGNWSTNWFTVTTTGQNAENMSSINKGERLDLSGSIRVRDWDNGQVSGTSVEVEPFTWEVITKRPAHNCNCDRCTINNKENN